MQRLQFPLFQTPIDLAHSYWKTVLNDGGRVIDATCGNGYDTLFLAQEALKKGTGGRVYALDQQAKAVEATKQRIKDNLPDHFNDVSFYQQCHSTFPDEIAAESVALIVYNLGYLPGSDKHVTTMRASTIKSLEAATSLLRQGGAISITCYPGHDEGKMEEAAILEFAAALNPYDWSCCHHRWLNRRDAPSLLLIQRRRFVDS